VKDEVDRAHPPDLARLDEGADAAHGVGVAVGQVEPKQPVGLPRGVHHCLHFGGGAAERLLTEYCDACFQRPDRLLGMQRAGSGNDDAVQTQCQQLLKATDPLCTGRELRCLRCHLVGRIGKGDRLDAGLDHRGHAVPPDPAGAQKADAHQKVTSALVKLPGRSRVALSASPKRSSG
jgi:hypothetical protein